MKVRYECPPPRMMSIMPKDIPVGTTFITSSLAGDGHIYLRTYSNIVALSDPDRTWNPLNMTSLLNNYRVVNAEVVVLP